MISGEAGEYHVTMSGEHAHDVTLLVGMNTSAEELQLWLPHCQVGTHWEWLIDTSRADGLGQGRLACGDRANVAAHSMIMLVSVTAPDTALVHSPHPASQLPDGSPSPHPRKSEPPPPMPRNTRRK
jgi:hypothetical protein